MKREHLSASLKKTGGLLLGALMALSVTGVVGAQAVDVKVFPDQAKLLTISGQPSTVVIGNPVYADVLVVGNKLLVQGRNYGSTNVIILDADGNQLASFDVVVAGRPKREIEVFKGGHRLTYICAPECARTLNPNDTISAMQDVATRIQLREALISNSGK